MDNHLFHENINRGFCMAKKTGVAPFVSVSEFTHTLDMIWEKDRHNLRNICVLYFSHFLGLRAKEMAALTIRDVFDPARYEIKETIRLLAQYTKGSKFREVYLVNAEARQYLYDYIMNHRQLDDMNAPLFLSQKGGAFTQDTMRKMIKICYSKANIEATSHSGRRAFATRLIRNNVDIYSIKELMGHSSISTTQKYFATDPNLLKEAVSKLNQ